MLINLRNALMTGRRRLPYDAEIEFLESTGTQWINTGVVATNNTRVKIAFSDYTQAGAWLFGARRAYKDSALGVYTNLNSANNKWLRAFGNFISDSFTFSTVDLGVSTFDYDCGHFTGTREKVPITVVATDTASAFTSSPYNIYLWTVNLAGTPGSVSSAKMYATQIWQNGVLVRDYIPVRRGTVGYLYDRVSGKLFGNAGTGDFVVGPDVVPVEYIESHGTEWIDTGVDIANSDDARFVTTCTITNTVANYSSTWVGSGVLSTGGLHYVLDHNGIRTGGGDTSMAIPYNRGDVVTIDVYYDSQHRRTCKIGQSIYQGTAYNASTAKLAILNYPAPTDITSHPCQAGNLFHVEVYKSSTLVRKFRPVRVGTDAASWEGAMMDTLTRRIYRNQGTGAFGYGNDLKYPIPAS